MAKLTRHISCLMITAGLFLIIAGCTRKVYVPVEKTVHDTISTVKTHIDSILARDSIYLDARGDTIVKEVYRWRVKVRNRVDTVYRSRTDTIRVYEAPVSVRKASRRVKAISSAVKWGARLLIIITLLIFLRKTFRRLKSRREI